MKTDELIAGLVADTPRRGPTLKAGLYWALAAALVAAALTTDYLLGLRPDALSALLVSARYVFKFVVTFALFATALHLSLHLARPGDGASAEGLMVPVLLLVAAVGVELLAVPEGAWMSRLIGSNWRTCLTYAPIISLGPLVLLLIALRRGAPKSPVRAGLVAGLAAGGIGTFFYAAHCPDDSPLFVAFWYSIVVAEMGALGALLGSRVLRW